MKPHLLLVFNCLLLLLGRPPCTAQVAFQSNAMPPNRGEPFRYLLIREATFKTANLVDTERLLPTGPQQLSIINLRVPLTRAAPGSFALHPGLATVSTMLVTLAFMPNEADNQVHWQPIKLDTLAAARQVTPAAFIVVLPNSWTVRAGYLSQVHESQTHPPSLHGRV